MSQALLSKIADEGIEYVDIRFTDPRGKLQHVTVCADQVDQDFLEEGFMFDGSSIAGWKSIEESDMKLMPDVNSAYVDPFYAEKTICIHCTVVEPDTGESYARDPRGCAQRAEAYLISSGIGDVAYMGPEAEFFCSMMLGLRIKSIKCRTRLMQLMPRGTLTATMKLATWATVPASKAAISP
jgi:glutamine synthetase